MSENDQINILVVEDQQIARTGLKLALERNSNFRVVGETASGLEAVELARQLRPDVVLMDIGLPDLNGIEATWQIKKQVPHARILMLTSHSKDEDISAAIGVGADGYCFKDVPFEELTGAIFNVTAGAQWVGPSLGHSSPKQNMVQSEEKRKASFLAELALKNETNSPNTSSNTYGSNEDDLSPGSCFDNRYRIESCIGQGGTGRVFKAKHLYIDRTVALKVLLPRFSDDRRLLRRFKEESNAACLLNHPNIISVHDFGVSQSGKAFIVMDYLEGETLDQVLFREQRISTKRFFNIFLQVCDAMAAAHAKGIIHCDLKPSNIMLLNSERESDLVKVVDFGLAKILPQHSTRQTQLTDSFEVFGSPLYMSPEQCLGSRFDLRSDIYALGSAMYEAISGVQLFQAETPYEMFSKHLREAPQEFRKVAPNLLISPALEKVIVKALSKDPQKRYQSMFELRQALSPLAQIYQPLWQQIQDPSDYCLQ